MGNPEYVKIVFGSRDIASEFAKYRKPFMKKDMTVRRKRELVKKGTEMLMNDSLSDTVYTPEVLKKQNCIGEVPVRSNGLCPP